MRRNRALRGAALCLAALLILPLGGCAGVDYYGVTARRDDPSLDGYTSAILPEGEGTTVGLIPATVYYPYMDTGLLAPVSYSFSLTAENTLEQLVVKRLIQGPDDGTAFTPLINPQTSIVQIKEQQGYLSITLSKEFLEEYEGWEQTAQSRRLAVLSIVDSITELGIHSRVLLLVDKKGDGTGERLTAAEAGLSTGTTLEPMARDTSCMLTIQGVARLALQAFVEKDAAQLQAYLAAADLDGTLAPDTDALTQALSDGVTLVSFEVLGDVSASTDGRQATVTVNYAYTDKTGHPVQMNAVPLRLIREDIWKVSFTSLNAGLKAR